MAVEPVGSNPTPNRLFKNRVPGRAKDLEARARRTCRADLSVEALAKSEALAKTEAPAKAEGAIWASPVSDEQRRPGIQRLAPAREEILATLRSLTSSQSNESLRRGAGFSNSLLRNAEGVGFEPTIRFRMPVFKTGAFNRSATPPRFAAESDHATIVGSCKPPVLSFRFAQGPALTASPSQDRWR